MATDLVSADAKGRRLAPPDTFYLLRYVSSKTDTGVIGFIPGQQVKLVEVHRPTETMVVTDGQNQVEVSPADLTNNLDIAALARSKDQAAQAKIQAYAQAAVAAYKKAQREGAENTARDLRQREEREDKIAQEVRKEREDQENHPNALYPGTTPAVAGPGYGYYDYDGDGFGSPYGYFVGQAVANGANRSAPAAAPAAKPALPNNVVAPSHANAAPAPAPAAPAAGGKPR